MGRKSRAKREARLQIENQGFLKTQHGVGPRHDARIELRLPFRLATGEADHFHRVSFIIGLVAALSTVVQGLFFQQDTLIAAAVIRAGDLVWLWWAGDRLSLAWADLRIVAYVALAALSFLWAANRQNVVAEGALWVSAAMVYLGLRRIRERDGFLDGVFLGGILLILFGVLEDLHVMNIYQWSLAGRLTSAGLQHPDAAGALAFALGFLALWRSRSADERGSSALIGGGAAGWTFS